MTQYRYTVEYQNQRGTWAPKLRTNDPGPATRFYGCLVKSLDAGTAARLTDSITGQSEYKLGREA